MATVDAVLLKAMYISTMLRLREIITNKSHKVLSGNWSENCPNGLKMFHYLDAIEGEAYADVACEAH